MVNLVLYPLAMMFLMALIVAVCHIMEYLCKRRLACVPSCTGCVLVKYLSRCHPVEVPKPKPVEPL